MGDDEYDRRHAALHQGTRLEWFTVFWNVIEVFVTVTLGLMAGSLALVAYGLDSVIEVFASLVVVRYISRHESGGQAARALRLVALAFGLLAAYLVGASSWSLAHREVSSSSPLGIAYLIIAATAMFVLALRKRRLAVIARSAPLGAEAALTFLDGCLASGILLALVLNAAFGLWWTDQVAAMGVGVICAKEAGRNWREASTLSTSMDDIAGS